jgi:sorbitol-specific phosphotransferase system component IIC
MAPGVRLCLRLFCYIIAESFFFFTGEAPDIQVAGYTFPAKNFMTCFYVIIGTLILSTGYLINRLATRKARRQQ